MTAANTRTKVKTKRSTVEADLDALTPTAPARDAVELRAIHDLAESIAANEQRLRDAVVAARAAGYSWGKITISLGVSPQAAHQRFHNVA